MKFIAEIGWNFVGDMKLAENMIFSAKKSGADYAKFQVWNPQYLKDGPWDEDGRREIYEKAYLNEERLNFLLKSCEQNNIGFFVSIFEKKSLQMVNSYISDLIKIPSHECTNFELIDLALSSFEKVFLSIGAIEKPKLDELIKRYSKNSQLEVMHCVSSYPLNSENVNLPKLIYLIEKFGKAGYSSHYTGITDAVVASGLGASIVEKHFTIDHDLPGRDNKFALLPDQFTKLISESKIAKECMQDKGLDIQDCENDVANIMRGRWSKNE